MIKLSCLFIFFSCSINNAIHPIQSMDIYSYFNKIDSSNIINDYYGISWINTRESNVFQICSMKHPSDSCNFIYTKKSKITGYLMNKEYLNNTKNQRMKLLRNNKSIRINTIKNFQIYYNKLLSLNISEIIWSESEYVIYTNNSDSIYTNISQLDKESLKYPEYKNLSEFKTKLYKIGYLYILDSNRTNLILNQYKLDYCLVKMTDDLYYFGY